MGIEWVHSHKSFQTLPINNMLAITIYTEDIGRAGHSNTTVIIIAILNLSVE